MLTTNTPDYISSLLTISHYAVKIGKFLIVQVPLDN